MNDHSMNTYKALLLTVITVISAFLNTGCANSEQKVPAQDVQNSENMRAAPMAQSPSPAMKGNWEY